MPARTSLERKEKKVGIIKKVKTPSRWPNGLLEGERVFILHGWAYSTEKWQPFVNLLKQKGINSTILKIPGLTEKIDRTWTIDDYINWLKNEIDKEKGKVMLIGHSNGGRIAISLAVRYPNMLSHLILIDAAGVYHNDLAIRFKRFMFKKIVKTSKKLSSSERLKSLLYKIVGESDYKNATLIMKQTMVNLINSDKNVFGNLDKIKVPTLIVWGREDRITPLSDGKLMHKLIKNSKLYVVKEARHSPHYTHAEEVANLISEYLKTQIAKLKYTS